jgi:hypothetical protein
MTEMMNMVLNINENMEKVPHEDRQAFLASIPDLYHTTSMLGNVALPRTFTLLI